MFDPRRTETAHIATRYLAARVGEDHAVLAFLVRELLRDGADVDYVDRYVSDVGHLARAVEAFDLETVSHLSGLDANDLSALLGAIRQHGRLAAFTGTGTSMSRSANVIEWLTWVLLIITGSLDRPGGMWFNPGFLKQLDRRALRLSSGVAGPGPRSRPELPQRWGEYPCAALSDEIEARNVRGLFVIGGNPLKALPDAGRLAAAMQTLDFLAVLDVVPTEATTLATHVLPSTGQLERSDLPLGLEQFLPSVATQYTHAVVPPGGERRPVWWTFAALAKELGLDVLPPGLDLETCTDPDILRFLARDARSSFDMLVEKATVIVAEDAVFGWVVDHLLPDG